MFCRQVINVSTGKVFNSRYVSGSRLAVGSYSTVYKVNDSKNKNLDLIMKVSRISECDKFYKAEIEALSQCRGNTSFPQMVDHFYSDNCCCIIMDDSGEQLNDVLNRSQKFNSQNNMRVSFSIMKALEFLHGRGFVHKDINDKNVMIRKDSSGVVSVRVINLGSSGKTRPSKSEIHSSYYASIYLSDGGYYHEMDDLISCIYLMTTLSGVKPFKSRDILIKAKKRFHQSTSSFFSPQDQWIAHLLEEVVTQRGKDYVDMTAVYAIFVSAVPGCAPASRISSEDVGGKIKIH